jgi:hypothetical protein
VAYNPVNPNGQATSANSAPVVVASDQSAIPVTANAGTNLNTSALALESGGNLAAVRTDIDYRFSGGKTSYAAVLNTSGNNVVITPAAGKRIRIFWVSFIPNTDNLNANLVTVKYTAGITMYVGYAMAHWELFTGAADDSVTVNLNTTEPVAITIHYQEIT